MQNLSGWPPDLVTILVILKGVLTMNNLYAILIVVIFLFLLTLCSVGGV